jgi:hypothetical protein
MKGLPGSADEWSFGLVLSDERDGVQVPRAVASDLLEHIVVWAEARGLSIGGGFSALIEEGSGADVFSRSDRDESADSERE